MPPKGINKESMEDYLKTVFVLSQTQVVHPVDIADKLGYSKPSVSVAVKKMEQAGYITVDSDHAITMTDKGWKMGKNIYDRNQTFEKLLIHLGIAPETAHRDAGKMEHALSQESFAAFKKMLVQASEAMGVTWEIP